MNPRLKQEDDLIVSQLGDWNQAQEAQLNQENNRLTTFHSSILSSFFKGGGPLVVEDFLI